MQWINPLFDWVKANESLLWWLFAGSIGLMLLTGVAVVWTLVQLPVGYFRQHERRALGSWAEYPALRIVLLIIKNALGAVLLVAGLLMLLAPGQGLLTLVVAVMLLDFPGKFRMQQWIVRRPSVWRSINWLRQRAGREPLKKPSD
jgi:hypothetical protein